MDIVLFALFLLVTGEVLGQVPPNLTCYSPRPFNPTCIDRYAAFPGHLNCENRPLTGKTIKISDTDLATIAALHNEIRTHVSPPAADMRLMKENPGLSSTADRWVRRCTADSTWYQRTSPGGYILGQNHLYSKSFINWTDVVKTWEQEKTNFAYGSTGNNASLVGNYTQMIWGETSSVGCSAANCGTFFIYICLYATIPNPQPLDKPYKESVSNSSCDDCPGHCNASTHLCDYGGLICLSGSKLNMTTYMCDCVSTVLPGTYSGSECSLNCVGTNDIDSECSRSLRGTCDTNMHTMFRCPWMCNVCPYSGSSWNVTVISRMPWEKGLPLCTTTTLATTLRISSSGSSTSFPAQHNSGPTAMSRPHAMGTCFTVWFMLIMSFCNTR
ncbi:cysteine-rich venom protein ENH2-like isoform X1 [Dreissena polymorpha]|uniref:cysteine-rich venom protein ENH2-like isoform X1 n=1 Tax=Dreissena polymorpha TaxID=45954 RepID=UPI0022648119|nr:cysteine-rich venom protein ENH2-like isoform X1 [Dreissena polymorpha]